MPLDSEELSKKVGQLKDRLLTRLGILLIMSQCAMIIAWIMIKYSISVLHQMTEDLVKYCMKCFYKIMGH